MHQECNELEWHSNWCLDSSNFSKIQGHFFPSQRTVFKEVNLGMTVDLTDASRSTVVIKCSSIKSSRLSLIRPIFDEGPRSVHVSLFETSCRLILRWILIQRS